ncbi:MAG: hypothetical protein WCH46_07140 [bacterium]
MKYLLLIGFATLLASCSSKPIVTVNLRNQQEHEYILVSIRDTSIIVLPTYEEIGKGIALTHAEVIPNKDITHITMQPDLSFLGRLPIGLFGAASGFALKACDCEDRLSHSVVGFAAGWTIGGFLFLLEHLKPDSYFLWLEADRSKLRKKAVYPVEPEIMKYVR